MTGLLASVTNLEEARIVLDAGVDIIDLKNPLQGALGALPADVIEKIVDYVAGRVPVSATVGDLPMQPGILTPAVEATAAVGTDIIKIGFFGTAGHDECTHALSHVARHEKIVAVLFADQNPDFSLLPLLADAGFYGVMLDTADKTGGGLRSWLSETDLLEFVRAARGCGLFIGLAGSLRISDIPPLAATGANYLGFRGALCTEGKRQSRIDPDRLISIRNSVAETQHQCLLEA
jgi:(5-formylfuran-3-yl)methyl phosphate synthase